MKTMEVERRNNQRQTQDQRMSGYDHFWGAYYSIQTFWPELGR